MTDGMAIFCCIYRTLETACYDNPLKSELLLRNQIFTFTHKTEKLKGVLLVSPTNPTGYEHQRPDRGQILPLSGLNRWRYHFFLIHPAKDALRAAVVSFSFVPAHLPGSDGNCGPVLLGEPSVARVEKLMHIAFVDVDLPVQQAL